jgi:WD40 repeat protein
MEGIGILDDSEDSVLSMVLSPQGQLFSASADKEIRCWDVEERKCLFIMKDTHKLRVNVLALTDKGHLVSGSADKHIKVWAINSEDDAEEGKKSRLIII